MNFEWETSRLHLVRIVQLKKLSNTVSNVTANNLVGNPK